MNLDQSIRRVAVAAVALVIVSAPSHIGAQPGAFGGGYGPPLQVVPPPKAEEMYDPETFGRGAADRVIVY